VLEFVTDRQIYQRVICELVPKTKQFLWLGTSDIKDLHVDKHGKMVPFLEVLSDLVADKVEIRLLHAKEPGKRFQEDFDRYPNLIGGMERILCPRVHLKAIVIDGQIVYTGSANLTGAGVGAKTQSRRNFESGIVTDNKKIVEAVMEQFDAIWRGEHCTGCKRKQYCADYNDMLPSFSVK